MAKNNSAEEADMSEKSGKTAKTTKNSFVKFCSFWGLTLAAVLFITNAVLNFINSDTLATAITVIDLIAKVCLLVAVGVPAFGYVRKKGIVWKIIFLAALVIYAFGVVFNVIHIG